MRNDDAAADLILNGHQHRLPADRRHERALLEAIDEVLGAGRGPALRRRIKGGIMGWADAAVLWLKRNLPEHAATILDVCRRKMDQDPAISSRPKPAARSARRPRP